MKMTYHEHHMCEILIALLRGETVLTKPIDSNTWQEVKPRNARDLYITTDPSIEYKLP
jgi:hypothetical protein